MATPHLTKSSRGTKPLNSLNGPQGKHLLIIRNTTSYNNTQMVVKPTDEWFVAAASWGNSSYYNSNRSADISQDATVIINNLSSKLGSCSWTHGHKAVFSYAARSGCPGRCAWQPSTVTQTILDRYMDFGISRNLYKLDLRYMPCNNFTQFKAYVRVYFPSFIQTLRDMNITMAYNYSHNNFTQIRYKFFDAMPTGNSLDSGFGSFDIIGNANEGKGSSSGVSVTDTTNYDPWREYFTCPQYLGDGYLGIYWWNGNSSFPNCYFDYEITDSNILDSLKAAMHAHRYVYMLVGFNLSNGLSGANTYGASPGTRVTSYVTQVQLVLKVSSSKFNQ